MVKSSDFIQETQLIFKRKNHVENEHILTTWSASFERSEDILLSITQELNRLAEIIEKEIPMSGVKTKAFIEELKQLAEGVV